MIKNINDQLISSDTIQFELEVYSQDKLSDPKQITQISISYINRNFCTPKKNQYQGKFFNPEKERELKEAQNEVNADPTTENVEKFKKIKAELYAASLDNQFYYDDTTNILKLGNPTRPAFPSEAVKQKSTGIFTFEWDSTGQREGDYFIVWTYLDQNHVILSKYNMFKLGANNQPRSIDTCRYTPKDKYEMLMNLYMPDMYKYKIKPDDITPDILQKFLSCVAVGFTELEDRANHLIDILDANTVDESLLPLLANFFNLELRSRNVGLWRRQIRGAIPGFKRKGSIVALKEALDQAGINLTKITRLWQITSEYVWTDGFVIANDTGIIGNLSKNTWFDLEVYLKSQGNYLPVPPDCVKIVDSMTASEKPIVVWQGMNLVQPIPLYAGDIVLVKYKIKKIPQERKAIEDYIQTLPLMDTRNESNQKYPLKNWNVRLLEEDDPLFNVIVANRHPFVDHVVFGKIRTTLLYSEKTYNMDTYDGSLRDSKIPCDIDKDFVDTCSYCQSSCFNVDLAIEDLSNERIAEAKEIIRDNIPFHAILYSINVSGIIKDFAITSDSVQTSVNITQKDSLLVDQVDAQEHVELNIEYLDGRKERRLL